MSRASRGVYLAQCCKTSLGCSCEWHVSGNTASYTSLMPKYSGLLFVYVWQRRSVYIVRCVAKHARVLVLAVEENVGFWQRCLLSIRFSHSETRTLDCSETPRSSTSYSVAIVLMSQLSLERMAGFGNAASCTSLTSNYRLGVQLNQIWRHLRIYFLQCCKACTSFSVERNARFLATSPLTL